jgi:alkylhydroperoxidase family enzyme
MALIETISPEKAEGKLAELYAATEQFFGAVPNNARLLGVSPEILENQLQIAEYYMAHPTLSVPFLAMVRMLVSKGTGSPYCRNLNAGLLMKAGVPKETVGAMQSDPGQAPLSDKDKALLSFVLKAADDPHAVKAEEVASLRSLGWKDADIFDAVAHAARTVATNIIFDTFKIEAD